MESIVDNREKITLSWENVTVSINDQKETFVRSIWSNIRRKSRIRKLEILKQVSGYAESNNMIAIMGPSGAGKTTLLSTIAKRIQPTSGNIKINGLEVSNISMSQISSYMDQCNAMLVDLTPREHLLFVCALKMNKNKNYREFSDRTDKLLYEFGLYEQKNDLITKLSAGERKRLFLISELVTRPKIIFLDEPTTDLDSLTALNVMQTLKLISMKDTLVICTIHQPGMAMYNLFTHIILLANGRNIFSGRIENVKPFFESLGFVCPIHIDQAEYHISILSQRDSITKSNEERSLNLSETFLRSPYYELPPDETDENLKEIQINLCNKPGPLKQFVWLIWRICKKKRRTFFSDNLSWISFLISMTVVNIFYSGNNPNTQKGMQNIRGGLYTMTSEIIFTVTYSVLYELPSDMINYRRETSMYGPGVYYIATFIGLIPKSIIKSFIFTLTILLTLNISWKDIPFYCLSTTLSAISGTAYGMMMSSWTTNIDLTTMIMVPIDILFLLTAGMFYNLRSLPRYLRYLKYLSIFYYVNESLSILYWTKIDRIECELEEGLPCLETGMEVLFEYGYNKSNFIFDLYGMICLTMFMSIVGYFGIKKSRRVRFLL